MTCPYCEGQLVEIELPQGSILKCKRCGQTEIIDFIQEDEED